MNSSLPAGIGGPDLTTAMNCTTRRPDSSTPGVRLAYHPAISTRCCSRCLCDRSISSSRLVSFGLPVPGCGPGGFTTGHRLRLFPPPGQRLQRLLHHLPQLSHLHPRIHPYLCLFPSHLFFPFPFPFPFLPLPSPSSPIPPERVGRDCLVNVAGKTWAGRCKTSRKYSMPLSVRK